MPVVLFNTNDVVQVRLMGTYFGERFQNVQHLRYVGGNGLGSVDLVSGIRNFFINQLMGPCSNQMRYTQIGVARAYPLPKGYEDILPIVPVVGPDNTAPFPHQVAYLWKIRTVVKARYGKGRMYMPGVVARCFADNAWTQYGITQFTSIAQIMRNEFGVNGGTALRWGVFNHGIHDAVFEEMTELRWSNFPATMRSRRPDVP